MKAALRSLARIGVLLWLSAVLSSKGSTSKIVISGAPLAAPIDISDANIVKQFQVWTGPGTTVCVGGRANCVEGTQGFIIDWLAGATVERPSGLQHYEVSFFVVDDRFAGPPGPEHLAYVVSYEYDPTTSQGYVYLPSKGDQWFPLNSASIYRGREGNWFRATPAWQDTVVPLITR